MSNRVYDKFNLSKTGPNCNDRGCYQTLTDHRTKHIAGGVCTC